MFAAKSLEACVRRIQYPRCHNLPISRLQTQSFIRHISNSSPRSARRYVRFEVDPHHPLDVSKWSTGTKVFVGLSVGSIVYYVLHLEKVPETGRWRFMDISPRFEATLVETAHQELLNEFKGKTLPYNHPLTRHIRHVVTRILESSNLGSLESPPAHALTRPVHTDDPWVTPTKHNANEMEWHLFVVNDDNMINAMASYGNIVVFTGILPVAKDQNGLAAVLGHEIAHVVARHNSERYSSMKVFIFLASIMDLIGIPLSRFIATVLYELPNSRTQEVEADKIGLKLSSRACFDPSAVPEMFKRLAQVEQAQGGLSVPFLNTHPSSTKRVELLQELLPQAYEERAASNCDVITDQFARFRDAFHHERVDHERVDDDGAVSWRWT